MKRITFLVDNGSKAPAATLRLREIARQVSRHVDAGILPVSLLHSDSVPASELDGVPARIFASAIEEYVEQGSTSFLVLPLFFGPSRALTDYIPERIAELRARGRDVSIEIAAPLFCRDDHRLARILADNVRAVSPRGPGRVALVDHGSPVIEVTQVRDELARQLAGQLGNEYAVRACSMERRPGPQYDFNEPLLEGVLASEGWSEGEVIVALQFLLPGRHAGSDGDVAQICRECERRFPRLRTRITPLVGDHPLLSEILASRWREANAPAR